MSNTCEVCGKTFAAWNRARRTNKSSPCTKSRSPAAKKRCDFDALERSFFTVKEDIGNSSPFSTLAKVLIVTVTLLSSVSIVVAQDGKDIFKDTNGYFAALRPKDWRQQDYPEETVRSKVTFHHPQINNINIRIIAGPTPTESYSLNDLLTESQEKINTFFKRNFPSGSFTVSKERVADREGIVHRNCYAQGVEQKIVCFVHKNVWYSIAYNGGASKADYRKGSTAFDTFLDSFTILDRGKKFTDAQIKASLVAKYRRMAKLFIEMGQKDETLHWIDQGLAIDPNDAGLKQLKQQCSKQETHKEQKADKELGR